MTNGFKLRHVITVSVAILLSLALVLASCAKSNPTGTAGPQKSVKVGLSLTYTGALGGIGAPVSQGAYDYLVYVNDVLGGVEYRTSAGASEKAKLDLLWEDNAYSVPKTLSIYQRQKSAGVQLMGMFGSTPGEAVASLASRDKMPIVGFYASASPVSMGSSPNYYTPSFGNLAETPGVMLTFISETWKGSKPARVGAIEIDLPSARSANPDKILPAYAQKLGLEWVGFEWTAPAATDYSIELGRLAAASPDFIISTIVPGNTVVLLKNAQTMGLTARAKFVLAHFAWDEGLIKLVPEAIEGNYVLTSVSLPSEDNAGIKLAKQVYAKYRSGDINKSYVEGVFYAMAIVEGVRQTLGKTGYDGFTGTAYNDVMHSLKYESQGLAPAVTIDTAYPTLNPNVKFAQIKGGQAVSASDWFVYPNLH